MGEWVTLGDDGKQANRGYRHIRLEHIAEPKLPPRERIHACYVCDPPWIGNRCDHPKHHMPMKVGELQ